MGKPKLGDKHLCANCETRYFDMGKNPPVCPSCATQGPVKKTKPKPKVKKSKAELAAAAAKVAADAAAAKEKAAAEETKAKDEKAAKQGIDGVEDGTNIDLDEGIGVDDDDDDEEEEQNKSLMEDASDLVGNDEDGMSEVMNHVETDKDNP